MSQTRYSPDELENVARILDAGKGAALNETWVAKALRQSASDARVLAQLREWRDTQHAILDAVAQEIDGLRGAVDTLNRLLGK